MIVFVSIQIDILLFNSPVIPFNGTGAEHCTALLLVSARYLFGSSNVNHILYKISTGRIYLLSILLGGLVSKTNTKTWRQYTYIEINQSASLEILKSINRPR